ncbi:MAG: dicarboxylate/amino acid:cation symporter, partial [Aeromonas veronii]
MKMNKLTVAILISMMFGILTGQGYRMFAADQAADFANNITILTDIFLRLIKMIIAPLVFTTLVVGIAKMGDTRTVGRIGAKTLGWFMLASLMSLSLGLVMVTLMQPGVGLSLSLPNDTASSGIAAGAITLKDFVTHAIPKSVVEAMATNEILQIVVFSLFFGLAAAALGDLAKPVVVLMASAAEIMLKVTGYVMNFAPFAVFGAIAAMVAKEGLGILVTYGSFMAQFYIALACLWLLLIAMGSVFLRGRVIKLLAMIREPILLAFSTASSEAAYPKTLDRLEKFGCDKRIASF